MSTTTAFRSPPPHTGAQGARGRPGPWVVAATRAVLNETQKGLWLLWGHRTVVLLEILGSVAFYPFLQFVIGNGTIQRALVRSTLLPFLAFPLLYLSILKLVSDLLEEVNSGTFEQMHLSPFSPASLLVGRLLAVFLEGLLIAVVLGVLMSWALGVSIPLRAAGLLPAALTLIDIAGFALLIGGLALSLPQIGAIAHLFGGLILLLNGAFVPLEWFPGWLQTLARFLPSTLGVQATRQVVLQGQSLGSVWADGTLPWLIIHAALVAVLGWLTLLFKRLEILKELFQIVVLIFGGVLVPLERMPGWMATIARFLPLTPGVDVLRKILLEGVSLGQLSGDGTLLWLVGSAAAYLLLGIGVFRWCERMAKRWGTLGQY